MIIPSGEIKIMTLPRLFLALHSEGRTGSVTLSRSASVKEIYFERGNIVSASSNATGDRLAECLFHSGKIGGAELEACNGIVLKSGKKQAAVLIERGFIPPRELLSALKLQVRLIVVDLFTWENGRYEFKEGVFPSLDLMRLELSTAELIVQGLSAVDWRIVRKLLPPVQTKLRSSADPGLFQDNVLEEDHRRIRSLIDGDKSIEDLCALSGIGDFNALKAIYVLLSLNLVSTAGIKSSEEKAFAETGKEDRVLDAGPEISKQIIQAACDEIPGQDHYQALRVKTDASGDEIRKSYFRLAKMYHPDRHINPEMSDMKEKLSILFRRINEAYETLSNPSRREEYDKTREGANQG